MSDILIPVSPGELVDKITILRIKAARVGDAGKLANIRTELAALEAVARDAIPADAALEALTGQLQAVNERLWEIEDAIRDCERRGDFGPAFISLARAVYRTNDRRAAIKREINERLGSAIVEEKSYTKY
ncbi:MAG: hypothetical protein D6754_17425 [Alphaproteobacteria bacterium]|nr:MAG: hypothetical protein D6754_17425 [Alphaproteobacteria bacterium]